MKSFRKGLATIVLAGSLISPALAESKTIEENVAVVVVDMQSHFLEEVDKDEFKKELPYQLDVLEYAKDNNIPVFVLEFYNVYETIPEIKEKIEGMDVQYFTKHNNDGFKGTNLDEKLEAAGIEHLVLMGVYASACVMETAKGALKHGYNILVSDDLIADPNGLVYPNFKEVEENKPWYKEHAIFRNDYKDLLEIISDSSVDENLTAP